MTFSSLVGERLKEQRTALRLSQAEAAERVGITREHLGRCERGTAVPGGEVLAALADLGVDVGYVLTGKSGSFGAAGAALTADERELLALFREATLSAKVAAINALSSGGTHSARPHQAAPIRQVNKAPHGIQVGAGKVVLKKGSG